MPIKQIDITVRIKSHRGTTKIANSELSIAPSKLAFGPITDAAQRAVANMVETLAEEIDKAENNS